MNFDIFALIVIPLLIFFARVIDVSLQTLRIIFTSKDRIYLAPIVGFFEVLIWLIAIGQIFRNLSYISYYIAYASGFAAGNFCGIYLERKISIGMVSIQLILKKNPEYLLTMIKNAGYITTVLSAEGKNGNVKLVILIIRRKRLSEILNIIEIHYPNAFISIEQVQSVSGGGFTSTLRGRSYFIRRRRK